MTYWWTDEKIDSAVTRVAVTSKLGPKYTTALQTRLAFGDGLTNDTYLDWILVRGKRLFLIFVDIGCPEHIFEAIDRSFDDDDLPLSHQAIWDLDLTRGKSDSLDKKFFKRQFHYIVQDLGPGRHVDYGEDDVVPVEPIAKGKGVLSNPDVDKVKVGGKTCIRRRIPLDGETGVDRIHFVLHSKALQRLRHPHLTLVWATYIQGDNGYILLAPCGDITLKSFLEEPPKHFRQLSKQEKRDIIIRWIHCLTDAIAYLHDNGYSHQAIRPSNIYIDSQYNIFLGEFPALLGFQDKETQHDRERYEYESPEQWRRKPIFQDLGASRSTLHGGGRTARRLKENIPLGATNPLERTSSHPQSPTYRFPPTRRIDPITSMAMNEAARTATQPIKSKRSSGTPTETSNSSNAETTTTTTRTTHSAPTETSIYPYGPPSTHAASSAPTDYNPTTTTTRSNSIAPTTTTTASSSSTTSSSGHSTITKRTLITTFATPSLPTLLPSDIFSLSTITLHLLSALFALASAHNASRFSASSLRSHLGKLNRNAGRGGAPADCSFHANLGQAHAWLDKVEKEAGKRSEPVFCAVPMLGALVRRGLGREGEGRWSGREGERVVRGVLERLRIGVGECCGGFVGGGGGGEYGDAGGEREFSLGVNRRGEVEIGQRKSVGASTIWGLGDEGGGGSARDSRVEELWRGSRDGSLLVEEEEFGGTGWRRSVESSVVDLDVFEEERERVLRTGTGRLGEWPLRGVVA